VALLISLALIAVSKGRCKKDAQVEDTDGRCVYDKSAPVLLKLVGDLEVDSKQELVDHKYVQELEKRRHIDGPLQ
jgi:hypothetical protein